MSVRRILFPPALTSSELLFVPKPMVVTRPHNGLHLSCEGAEIQTTEIAEIARSWWYYTGEKRFEAKLCYLSNDVYVFSVDCGRFSTLLSTKRRTIVSWYLVPKSSLIMPLSVHAWRGMLLLGAHVDLSLTRIFGITFRFESMFVSTIMRH